MPLRAPEPSTTEDALDALVRQYGADVQTHRAANYLFAAAALLDRVLEIRVLRPIGLTTAGWRIVLFLTALGPAEPRELARRTMHSRASVVNALNTLERKGFVSRAPIPHDRRLVKIELTEKGAALAGRVFAGFGDVQERSLVDLEPQERRDLATLLRAVVVRLQLLDDSEPADFRWD